MKRGFTLVEIILSISIVLIVGVSTTFFMLNNKKNNELENITKQLLEAANAYIKIEKDNNGNIYANEIINGKKGVKIPVSNLVDKGYVEEEQEKQLYKLNNETKEEDKSYYIMFVEDTNNYCDDGSYITVSSWIDEGNDVYLCDSDNFIKNNIMEFSRLNVSLDKYAVSEEYYNNASEEEKEYLTKDENGLFTYYDEKTGEIFNYFRGAVNNNYVKFGYDKNGNNLYWRILWISNDNKMKLVLDDVVPLYITNGEYEIKLKDIDIHNSRLIQLNEDRRYNTDISDFQDVPGSFIFSRYSAINDADIEKIKEYLGSNFNDGGVMMSSMNKIIKVTSEPKFLFNKDFTNDKYFKIDNTVTEENFYNDSLLNWYNDTTLDEDEYEGLITKENNFCNNYAYTYDASTNYKFYASSNFYCVGGDNSVSSMYYDCGNVSSPVGYLTYGDVVRAGLMNVTEELYPYEWPSASEIESLNLNNQANYLVNDNYNIAILFNSNGDSASRNFFYNYVYSNKGIKMINYYSKFNFSLIDNGFSYTPQPVYIVMQDKDENIISIIVSASNPQQSYAFSADALKPTIILDMTNYKLSDASGIKKDGYDDSYTIIPK